MTSLGKELCETHASSFSLAAQFLPEEKRNAAYEIYGFCRATDQILDGNDSAFEKEEQLRAWKTQLERAWSTNSSENPLIHGFVSICKKYSIPSEWGFRLIEGMKRDLLSQSFENFDELYAYCFAAASIPGIMISHVFGARKEAYEHAVSLGIAMQLTNILRDIKEDYEMGRVYLPRNEIANTFVEMMQFQIARARYYYAHAEKGIPFIDEESQFCVRLCLVFYREILTEIEKANYDVFSSRIRVSDARKKELIQLELQNAHISSSALKT